MRPLFKLSLSSAAFALVAGCANMGNPGGHETQSNLLVPASNEPQPIISEKIELQIPFDKWELSAEHKTELAQFLRNLRTATPSRPVVSIDAVIVTGHTDRIGPLSYNMKVSERLAEMAKDYLVAAENVDPTLIFWEGKGPKQPVPVTQFCDNTMATKPLVDCLAPNRRVTVEVVGAAMPQPTVAGKQSARLAATH